MKNRLSAILLVSVTLATPVVAAEYSGRIGGGAFTVTEQHVEPSAGEISNDRQIIFGRAFLDVTEMGPYGNEFTLDLREKYDLFGTFDPTQLQLTPSNDPALRQLAIKLPSQNDGLFWSLGRFPVVDAAVLTHDGAELGYRFTSRTKAGFFGGVRPERRDGKNLELSKELPQAGLYTVYHNRGDAKSAANYVAGSLVSSQEHETVLLADGTEREADTPQLRLYLNSFRHADDQSEFVTTAYINVNPKAYLRTLSLLYAKEFDPKFTTRFSLYRFDVSQYPRIRDMREKLEASAYTQGKVEAFHHLTKQTRLDYAAIYGTRSLDKLNRYEASLGLRLAQLFTKRLDGRAGLGYRHNFTSNDVFVRFGAEYIQRQFELYLDQQYIVENRTNGSTLHPLITDIGMNLVIARQVFVGLAAQYAKDEEATVSSGLIQLNYRFSSQQLTPLRDRPPPLEVL